MSVLFLCMCLSAQQEAGTDQARLFHVYLSRKQQREGGEEREGERGERGEEREREGRERGRERVVFSQPRPSVCVCVCVPMCLCAG